MPDTSAKTDLPSPHQRPRTLRLLAAAALLAAMTGGLVACSSSTTTTTATSVDPNAAEVNPAGDIPDNQVYVPWADPSGAFTLTVPEGWARSTDTGVVAFTDKLNTIQIESTRQVAAPDLATVTADVVPALRTQPGYVAGDVTAVARTAGDGILVTYQAAAAPDPVTGKVVQDAVEQYRFWNAGTLVVLTLSGPVGADNVDPWRIVTDSLTWTP
ncbi:MAG: hypothetical protein ACOH10_11220 [Rhodoglobus sp.]